MAEDGNSYGPVDFQTLKSWANDGRVGPNTSVRDELSQNVTPAAGIPGLFPSMSSPNFEQGKLGSDPNAYLKAEHLITAEAGRSFTWAIIDAVLTLIFFFVLHGLGIIVLAYSFLNSFNAKKYNHPRWQIAMACSVVSAIILAAGYIMGFARKD